MKLTKKQKVTIESLHNDFRNILIENAILAKENNWDITSIEMRGTYDSFRILNLIQDKFK